MKIISSGRGIHSPEFYKKKQRAKRIRLALYFIVSVLLLVGLVLFLRWEKFLISEVVLAENIVVDREAVLGAITRELSGYYLSVIPKNNAIIYRRKLIKEKLLAEFPRFKSLDLNLRGFKKLAVSVDEREPFALYCAETANCFFLDEEGLIYRAAPSFSDGVYFIYALEHPLENPLGQTFLPSAEFKLLAGFIDSLSALSIRATTLKVSADNYGLKLVDGGEIIWKREADLGVIYSNLEAFLSDEAIKSQTDFLERVSHLDLRTENKVFFKFK